MSATTQNNANPNALYRFDPELGFIEVSQTQNQEQDTTLQMGQMGQNPQMGYYQQNPMFQNPYGYCPPFAPHFGQHAMFYNNMQAMQKQAHDMQKMQEEFAKYMSAMQMQQMQQNLQDNTQKPQQAGLTQEKIQEIYSVVNDAINGNPDPNKMLGLLQSTSGDFWKGLAIGAGAILLFNYSPLKTMFASMLGSFGANQATEESSCDCNEE